MIQPDELVKHGFPRPKDVRMSKQRDSIGDESLFIYLVFPNKTRDKDLAWEKVEPMVSWVQHLLSRETEGELFPYVWVKRQKDLDGEKI